MTRRDHLACLLGAAIEAGCSSKDKQPASRLDSLRRGVDYLWSRQSDDGGWHSDTYGLLRGGESLTAFVLAALLHLPDPRFSPREKVTRGIVFIEERLNDEGALGRSDPGLNDYPNYATALAVTVLSRARQPEGERTIARMTDWLRGQQFTEQNGWKPADAPYGAWGMGGDHRIPPNPGHVDLSMTRHVIQALRAAGAAPDDPAFQRARLFLERCQNFDTSSSGAAGGFFFSTVVLDANKAGNNSARYRSYGTTTADGILSLVALGRRAGDARLDAAKRWLVAHHLPDRAPGFSGETQERFAHGLRFYYASAAAEAFCVLGLSSDRRLAADLGRSQRPDGSWANSEKLVKEDDPLIATAFAVRALAAS